MNNKSYWNDYYSKSKAICENSLFSEFVVKQLVKGSRLLEIGCGNGRDAVFFAQNDFEVECLDTSEEAIKQMQKLNLPRIKAKVSDFTTFNKGNYFDAIYSRFSLHMLTDDELYCCVKNVYANLKKAGFFFIETRTVKDTIFGKGEPAGRNAYIYQSHYRHFLVKEELEAVLTTAGFTVNYSEEKSGFAPFEGEDPIILRIVAVKA
jgi:cyclopropane fatty-acyl-phospholipid synthase-like methyltransferase